MKITIEDGCLLISLEDRNEITAWKQDGADRLFIEIYPDVNWERDGVRIEGTLETMTKLSNALDASIRRERLRMDQAAKENEKKLAAWLESNRKDKTGG